MASAIQALRTAERHKTKSSHAWWLIAFLVVSFFAAKNLSTWPARIQYPGEESYEGFPLCDIVNLEQGVPIYREGAVKGFDGAIYGPLYYLLGTHLVNPSNPSYLPLRLLSVVAILGCAACCGVLAFWLSGSYAAALLSLLMFLSYGMTSDYGISALSDGVSLLLFFSGFLVAYRFRHSRAILLSAPLICIGFYYKPQYIAGPLAVFGFLLLKKRYRRAAEFAGLLTFWGLGSFAYFQWAQFSGQAFWRHFLSYDTPLFSWHLLAVGSIVFGFMLGIPLLLSADYLRRYPDKLLACYLACAVLLGLATIGKEGSNVHYFFECILVVSVLIPVLIARNTANGTHTAEVVIMVALSVLLGQAYRRPVPTPADFARNHAILTFLHGHFPTHSKALGVFPGDLIQAGLDVPFVDLFQLSHLARQGKLSDRGLVGQIRGRRFAVIVLDIDLHTEHNPERLNYWLTGPMRNAIRADYTLSTRLAAPSPVRIWNEPWFYIYTPKAQLSH